LVVIIETDPIHEPENSEGYLKEINSTWTIIAIIFPFAGILGGLYFLLMDKRGSERLLILSLLIALIWVYIFQNIL